MSNRECAGQWSAMALVGAVVAGCGGDQNDPFVVEDDALTCDLDLAFLADGGVGRDGIPAFGARGPGW